jgi:predicted MFS family arabinose efflux permease
MANVLRAAEGVTWTIMFSTAIALTAEISPPHRLAQAIGLAGGASLIMNAVAPAIGEPLSDRLGYRPVFLLASLAAAVAAFLARRLRVADAPPGGHTGRSASVTATAGGTPRWLPVYVVFALAGLAFSVVFTFLAPFALAQGVHAIRAFFISYTCAALAVRLLGGRMADRLGHGAVAARAVLLYGFVIASAGFVGPHHLVVLGIGFGMAHGAAFPALMALLVSGTPPARRPRVLGIANGAMSIGISAVFPAGMLVKPLGYAAVFALAGGLTAASAALIWGKAPRR